MIRAIVLCAFAFAWAQSAAAGPIQRSELDSDDMAWFYNRPGATLAQLNGDTAECQRFGEALINNAGDRPTHGGLVGAAIVGLNSAAPARVSADDCMIARGYRRFTTADPNLRTFVQRYEALDEAARLALAGSERPPEGELTRQWANDFWSEDETRDVPRPPVEMRPRPQSAPVPTEVLDEANLDAPITLGANEALVIFSIQSGSERTPRGGFVLFTRDDPETGFPDLLSTRPDGRRMRWPVIRATFRARATSELKEFAYVVPAGHYALASLWAIGGYSVDFCMGTPAFNVEPGEVLHLGKYVMQRGSDRVRQFFDAAGVGVRVDTVDLSRVRERLGASPDLSARVAHAQFQNGFVRACPLPLFGFYGFDLPGAPWLPSRQTPSPAK